jgi:organic radical activating enzyme
MSQSFDPTYDVVEIFHSVQGEGLYAGTPMTFIRFVGCSVGKKICHHCDTDFDTALNWKGGGRFSVEELAGKVPEAMQHVCFTGGEPLNQTLFPLVDALLQRGKSLHMETSGTVHSEELRTLAPNVYICVSPKPGFLDTVIRLADEIKVIVPGLGNGPGWPSLKDAIDWAEGGKLVYIQPRNAKHDVDQLNLRTCLDLVQAYPSLRLSVQLHKFLVVQ